MEYETLSVTNTAGEVLSGIVHLPSGTINGWNPRIGIHLLNPGLKCRVGPNRINKRIADTLCGMGYWVLRSDPAGIGDSEGELPDLPVADLWGMIQMGRFVPDVNLFHSLFRDRYSLNTLILAGSCGGAITALLAAALEETVRGIVLIDLPVTLSSSKTERSAYVEILSVDDASRKRVEEYYRKAVINTASIKRFLTLKSDYRAIWRVFQGKWNDHFGNKDTTPPVELENINPMLLDAWSKFAERQDARACFLCAEKDTDTQLFNKGFRNVHLVPEGRFEGMYRIEYIPDANHIYSEEAAQQGLTKSITSWISVNYPLPENNVTV